jgi:hypothetical protein
VICTISRCADFVAQKDTKAKKIEKNPFFTGQTDVGILMKLHSSDWYYP